MALLSGLIGCVWGGLLARHASKETVLGGVALDHRSSPSYRGLVLKPNAVNTVS